MEHKAGKTSSYTKKYSINRLIYVEETDSIHEAIQREKEIKGWKRNKKLSLVRMMNPEFKDISEDWFE